MAAPRAPCSSRVDARIVLGCALLCAVAAGALALAGGQDYRARSFVIRVPPDFAGERGIGLARGDAVLARALELAGEGDRDAAWLRGRSTAELTSRQDLSFTVEAPGREQSAALATAYAMAYRERIPRRAGLTTRGRGARDAQRTLGPVGWTLLGGLAGLWLGMALAIVLDGRAPRLEPDAALGRAGARRLAADQLQHLVPLGLHVLARDQRLQVEPQERLGVGGPHVQVPVVVVDRDAVEPADLAV